MKAKMSLTVEWEQELFGLKGSQDERNKYTRRFEKWMENKMKLRIFEVMPVGSGHKIYSKEDG